MNTMKKILTIIFTLLILIFIIALIYKFGINKNYQKEKINLTPSAEITPIKISNIILTEDGFKPNQITIPTDSKIVWINQSGHLATVDSNPHPDHTDHPELNLGEFKDQEKISLIFRQPGIFKFHNHYDPNQEGTIIVK